MAYYPDVTLLKEAQFLREHVTKWIKFLTDPEAVQYSSLIPNWSATRVYSERWILVKIGSDIYRKYTSTTTTKGKSPAEDLANWYKVSEEDWTEYSEGTYQKGEQVSKKASEYTTHKNYYISLVDNNTTTPPSSGNWGNCGGDGGQVITIYTIVRNT